MFKPVNVINDSRLLENYTEEFDGANFSPKSDKRWVNFRIDFTAEKTPKSGGLAVNKIRDLELATFSPKEPYAEIDKVRILTEQVIPQTLDLLTGEQFYTIQGEWSPVLNQWVFLAPVKVLMAVNLDLQTINEAETDDAAKELTTLFLRDETVVYDLQVLLSTSEQTTII